MCIRDRHRSAPDETVTALEDLIKVYSEYYIDFQSNNPNLEYIVPFIRYNQNATSIRFNAPSSVPQEKTRLTKYNPDAPALERSKDLAITEKQARVHLRSKKRPDLDTNKDGLVDEKELEVAFNPKAEPEKKTTAKPRLDQERLKLRQKRSSKEQ